MSFEISTRAYILLCTSPFSLGTATLVVLAVAAVVPSDGFLLFRCALAAAIAGAGAARLIYLNHKHESGKEATDAQIALMREEHATELALMRCELDRVQRQVDDLLADQALQKARHAIELSVMPEPRNARVLNFNPRRPDQKPWADPN